MITSFVSIEHTHKFDIYRLQSQNMIIVHVKQKG